MFYGEEIKKNLSKVLFLQNCLFHLLSSKEARFEGDKGRPEPILNPRTNSRSKPMVIDRIG